MILLRNLVPVQTAPCTDLASSYAFLAMGSKPTWGLKSSCLYQSLKYISSEPPIDFNLLIVQSLFLKILLIIWTCNFYFIFEAIVTPSSFVSSTSSRRSFSTYTFDLKSKFLDLLNIIIFVFLVFIFIWFVTVNSMIWLMWGRIGLTSSGSMWPVLLWYSKCLSRYDAVWRFWRRFIESKI